MAALTDSVKTLDVAKKILPKHSGFTMDYGASMVKIIYITKVDEDKIQLHFTSYPRNKIEDAFKYIQDHAELTSGQEVYVTGIGCTQHRKLIESTLDIRLKDVNEFESFVDGALFLLRNFPRSQVVHPLSAAVLDHARTTGQAWRQMIIDLAQESGRVSVPESYRNENISLELKSMNHDIKYPLLLVTMGSASGPFLVHEDGKYTHLDLMPICGRTLLGLGSLLVGTQSFDELVCLAEKGSSKALDVYLNQLEAGESTDLDYLVTGIDVNIFSFSRAIGHSIGDHKREDLAAAVVSLITTVLGKFYSSWAKSLRAEYIVLTGGLFDRSQLIRDQLSKISAYQCITDPLGVHTVPVFLKYSAYTGALGALLAHKH